MIETSLVLRVNARDYAESWGINLSSDICRLTVTGGRSEVDNRYHVLEFDPDDIADVINYLRAQVPIDFVEDRGVIALPLEKKSIYDLVKGDDLLLYLFAHGRGTDSLGTVKFLSRV